jgi:hypothetical protein
MVSFRYHLVSIIAVFLALAVGIAMGATVIDKATVDLLRSQISTAKAQRATTQHENDILKNEEDAIKGFEADGAPLFVQGALSGVPVMIIDMQGGTVKQNVSDVTALLVDAGANVQGSVDLTKALALDKADNTSTQLYQQLGLTGSLQADDVRKGALDKLAAWLANPGDPAAAASPNTPLAVMDKMKLVQWTHSAPPTPSTRFVVISGAQPDVPNEEVALPFTTALTLAAKNRVLAAEAGDSGIRDGAPPVPEVREVFTGPLRTSNDVKDLVTTVDNLEDPKGQVALVFALRNIPTDTGHHYGVGKHASDGFVPKS